LVRPLSTRTTEAVGCLAVVVHFHQITRRNVSQYLNLELYLGLFFQIAVKLVSYGKRKIYVENVGNNALRKVFVYEKCTSRWLIS